MTSKDGDPLHVLAQSPVFETLSREELAELVRHGRRQVFPAGSALIEQGTPSDSLHVILAGRVGVQRSHPAVKGQLVMAEVGPGETVGEMGVVDRAPRSATAVALDDTETLELSTDLMDRVIARRPQVAMSLARLLSLRLRGASELMERMARWGSEIAVARSRWEERFLTDERTALSIIEEAARNLDLADAEYGTPWRTTTYCDTEDFSFYKAAEAQESSSFRFREYHSHRPKAIFGSPTAWLELKGTATCGDKYRVEVPVHDIPGLMRNAETGLASLGVTTSTGIDLTAPVQPVVITQCYRVAYASPGEGLRITADYGLTYSVPRWTDGDQPSLPVPIRGDLAHERGVVVEVKWTDQLPDWAADIVRNLRLTAADPRPSKFVVAVRHLRGGAQPQQPIRTSQDTSVAEALPKRGRGGTQRLTGSKAELLTNAAFELRGPLSSITACSELLVDDPKMDLAVRIEFAGIINAEAKRLSRLVDDVIDLSRIESGAITWRMVPADLADELQRMLAAHEPAASRKGLALRLEVDADLPHVLADLDGLSHTMNNLIANAIECTKAGEVVVSATRHDLGVEVSVADSGPGFSEDEQSHIFDHFYQAGSILTEKPVGSGLSLAICQRILEQHGSRLRLRSEVGKGSRFSFDLQPTLPAGDSFASHDAVAAS